MKNINSKIGRFWLMTGVSLLLVSLLTSCYIGQTYAGEDSVYYNPNKSQRKKSNTHSSYDYVYNDNQSFDNSEEIRIGKRYIDPMAKGSDLLNDDTADYSTNNSISDNSSNANTAQSFYYNNNNNNGWGDDQGTIINNYYYGGGYYPYYGSYYWGNPWGFGSYWRPYGGWSWGISIGWNWGWSDWGWGNAWGPSWGWGYPSYWGGWNHHGYWGWSNPRYYANYGPRPTSMVYGGRNSSYLSRSYSSVRSMQLQESQRQTMRNNIISGSRGNVYGSRGNIVTSGSRITGNSRDNVNMGSSRGNVINNNAQGRARGDYNNGSRVMGGYRNDGVVSGSRGGMIDNNQNNSMGSGSRDISGTTQSSRTYNNIGSRSTPSYSPSMPSESRGTIGNGSFGGSRGGSMGGGSFGGSRGGGSFGGGRR